MQTRMKDEIEKILEKTLYCRPRLSGLSGSEYVYGIDKAAQAIADWIENQPVDRVRAMAALVECHGDTYIVAGDEVGLSDDDRLYCLCCYEFDCEHVRAVELYLAQNVA